MLVMLTVWDRCVCVSLAMNFLSTVQNITCVTADRTCCCSQPYRKDKEFVEMSIFKRRNSSSSRYTAMYGHTLNDKSCTKGFRCGFPACATNASFSRQKVAFVVTVARNGSIVWTAEATMGRGRFHNNEEVEILLREWFKMQFKFLPQRNISTYVDMGQVHRGDRELSYKILRMKWNNRDAFCNVTTFRLVMKRETRWFNILCL
jgi:hypothetical protein